MVGIHWKYLVFLLLAIFLCGCEYDSETIGTPSSTTKNKERSITSDHEVIELHIDDIEAILPDIRVPTNGDVEGPAVEPANNEAVREIDLNDIQNIIPNVRVPVHKEPKKDDKKDITPPKIVHSNIKDGAKNIGRSSLTRITFNEPIAKGNLVLRTEDGSVVETKINYGNKVVNIERLGKDFTMEPLTTYIIAGSVSDAAGNKAEINITFTTGRAAIEAF